MIRLIDRYVLSTFLAALVVFTVAFVAIFVTVDFASKLGSFLELKSMPVLIFIGRYYACRLPMIVTLLLPTVILFAAMFTVIKLARTNEILPIAASGTSLRRMCAPFLVAGAMGSLGMAAMDEYVLARLGQEIIDTEGIRTSREVSFGVEDYDGYWKLWGEQYDHVHKVIQKVKVTRTDDLARPVLRVTATECRWDVSRRRWVAFQGEIEYPREFVQAEGERPRRRKEPIPPEGYVVEAPFTPETLRTSASIMNRFISTPLRQSLREAREHPREPVYQMRVHARFAFPLSPIVLLLLGLPSVLAAHSKSFLKGLFFCFLLAVAYYIAHFACLDLGNRGSVPPVVGGWAPTGVFGLVGLASFVRMKT